MWSDPPTHRENPSILTGVTKAPTHATLTRVQATRTPSRDSGTKDEASCLAHY